MIEQHEFIYNGTHWNVYCLFFVRRGSVALPVPRPYGVSSCVSRISCVWMCLCVYSSRFLLFNFSPTDFPSHKIQIQHLEAVEWSAMYRCVEMRLCFTAQQVEVGPARSLKRRDFKIWPWAKRRVLDGCIVGTCRETLDSKLDFSVAGRCTWNGYSMFWESPISCALWIS